MDDTMVDPTTAAAAPAGAAPAGGSADVGAPAGPVVPPPALPPQVKLPKLPFRARVNLWLRRARFTWAWRVVHGMDGVVMSDAAVKAAVMELARLPGWVDELFRGQPRKVALLTARLEGVTQLLALAAEIGEPSLQAQALIQLYTQLRALSMSRRQ